MFRYQVLWNVRRRIGWMGRVGPKNAWMFLNWSRGRIASLMFYDLLRMADFRA